LTVTVPPLPLPAPLSVYSVPSTQVVSLSLASVNVTATSVLARKSNTVEKAVVEPSPM